MNRIAKGASIVLAAFVAGCGAMLPVQSDTAAAANVRRPAVPERSRMLGTASTITVYTREDLISTGEMDPVRALRQLDPRFY